MIGEWPWWLICRDRKKWCGGDSWVSASLLAGSHCPGRPNTTRYGGLLQENVEVQNPIGSPGCARRTSALMSQSVSAFLFSYPWQKYLETAPFSLWSCHTASLMGQFFLPFRGFRTHIADPTVLPAPEGGDCPAGGGHVSLTDVFDMLIQIRPVSTNACGMTSCHCHGWPLLLHRRQRWVLPSHPHF